MMNGKLYRTMLKVYSKSITSYAIGSALYLWLIIALYPSIANAKGLQELMQSLPQGFLKAFDMEAGFQSLGDFIAGKYYGSLLVVILAIFSLITASQLIAKLVERGSMAYLLATPNSRRTISVTQALVLITGLLVIVGATTVTGLLVGIYGIEGTDFQTAGFLKVNLMVFLLFFVVSGYAFLFSCWLNDEKQALGISAVITMLFYGADFAGKLSENLEWTRNISLFSLFDPVGIANESVSIVGSSLFLAILGIILYSIGTFLFQKRDLPL